MVKKKPKPLLFILLFIIMMIIASIVTWSYLSSPIDKKDSKEIEIVIDNGMTSSEIGHVLKANDLIHSELLFKIYLKVKKVNSLKASTYILHRDMNLEEIVKCLEKGNDYNGYRS